MLDMGFTARRAITARRRRSVRPDVPATMPEGVASLGNSLLKNFVGLRSRHKATTSSGSIRGFYFFLVAGHVRGPRQQAAVADHSLS